MSENNNEFGTSKDIESELIDQLKDIIPMAFSEDDLDCKKLKELLGQSQIPDSSEKYNFTWAGRKKAFKHIRETTTKTLKPIRDESVNFDETENLFIEGDNLEVLKILQNSYYEKVKMIYIDPPYNTGNDFVYKDDFKESKKEYEDKTGQRNEDGKLVSNPETGGRYHSNWLTMMYPRLFLARNLLKEDGVIFVSIDDNEVHNLRLIMNEIFGEENFLTQIVVQSNKRGQTYKQISKTHEYVLVYTKHEEFQVNELKKTGEKDDLNLSDSIGRFNIRGLRNRNPKFGKHNRPNLFYPIYVNPTIKDKDDFSPVSLEEKEGYSIEVYPLDSKGRESCWRWGQSLANKNIEENTLESNLVAKEKLSGGYNIYEKYRKSTYKAKSIWTETEVINEQGTVELGKLGLSDYFDFPKPLGLIEKIIKIGSDSNDIILDFFAGSCTTAHAVLKLNKEGGNRKFIMIQLPEKCDENSEAYKAGYETIADIGKERIRRVIENQKKEKFGFKPFKLQESNFTKWSPPENKEELKNQLRLQVRTLREGASDRDVIYEILLKEGFTPNAKINEVKNKGKVFYKISGKENIMYFSLEDNIEEDDLEDIPLSDDTTIILLDSSLSDTEKDNISRSCNLKTV